MSETIVKPGERIRFSLPEGAYIEVYQEISGEIRVRGGEAHRLVETPRGLVRLGPQLYIQPNVSNDIEIRLVMEPVE